MTTIYRSLGILLLTSLAAGATTARCVRALPAESFQRSDAVFIGQVIRVSDDGDGYFIRVLKSWKGLNDARIVVRAHVDVESLSCNSDYVFALGETYVIYASAGEYGDVHVSACSPTAPLL